MVLPPRPPTRRVGKPPRPPVELPSTEEIPPELQALLALPQEGGTAQRTLLTWLQYWNEVNPQGLYEMRLTDYLTKLYQEKMVKVEATYNDERAIDEDEALKNYLGAENKVRSEIEAYEEQAKFKRDMNFPIEDMPFYDEVTKTMVNFVTPSVEKAYNQFRQQRFAEEQYAAQQQEDFEEKYADWEKQQEMRGAEEAAQAITKGSQRYYQAKQAAEKQAALAQTGLERGLEANPQMSQQEAQTVFGRQPISRAGVSAAMQTLANLIAQAQQYGIDTSMAESALRQRGNLGDEAFARESQGLNAAIQQAKQAQRIRESTFLQQQYPGEFQAWAAQVAKSSAGQPPQGFEANFVDWVNAAGTDEEPLTPQQIAFQRRRKDTELQGWQKYGDFYGAYQDYLSRASGYTPIEQWIESTPQVKVAWERRQRPAPRQPYARWR